LNSQITLITSLGFMRSRG